MRQGDLFGSEMEAKFQDFHAAHPEVYAALVRFAREMKARGLRHGGIRMLWERVRWYVTVERTEEFKLNDHYHSRYARLIMSNEPDFKDFFELRELRS